MRSDPAEVHFGAPQGGVFAPLAFIVYINDLLTEFNDQHVLSLGYADDSCFLLRFASQIDSKIIEQLLTRVQGWSDSNGLLLNANKCTNMIFGNQPERPRSTLGIHSGNCHRDPYSCPVIQCVQSTKYLGNTTRDHK